MKRILAILLVVVAVVGVLPAAAFASENLNQTVAAKAKELEDKYGIAIQYPLTKNGDSIIVPNSLDILDGALGTMTPSVVRQVSSYYYNKIGRRLTFKYAQTGNGLDSDNIMVDVGGFSPGSALIELYIPMRSSTTIMTGENPVTIAHEFGHALHFMIMDSYGYNKMYSEWTAFNSGISYNSFYILASPDAKTFMSGYAATMFEEDVAELIGHCFILNKAGQGFAGRLSSNGQRTGLGKKVDYLDNLLATHFPNDTQMLANFRKTRSVSSSINYQGMTFSGLYLQYMGYAQPRYILNGTLNALGKQQEYAIWIREIGGWYVREPSGKEIVVFPDGVWGDVPAGFVVPKAAA